MSNAFQRMLHTVINEAASVEVDVATKNQYNASYLFHDAAVHGVHLDVCAPMESISCERSAGCWAMKLRLGKIAED